jgi:hypothetical protein
MSRTRLILISISAVFAVSAAAASAASQYFVAGAKFKSEESMNVRLKSGTSAVLVSKLTGGVTIEIVCKATKLKSGVIRESYKISAKAIVYEKCSDTPATCKVSETLNSSEVVGEMLDVGTEGSSMKFKPATGETFISLDVTGCSGEGKYSITGSAECELVAPAVEAVDKACNFTTTSGSSLNGATLTEEAEFVLSGEKAGSKWHIRH